MARSTIIYRCPGRGCVHRPILGAFLPDGALSLRHGNVSALIPAGPIVLSCRQCGTSIPLTLPLADASARYLCPAPAA